MHIAKYITVEKIWREPFYDIKYWGKRVIVGAILMILVAYLFFQSFWALLPLQIAWIPYWKICIQELMEDKRLRYLIQFRDFLQVLSGNLQAGQSVENGIRNCLGELEKEWGINSFIYKDVYKVARKIQISGQCGESLKEWGDARDSQDLRLFITVFLYGRKTGGDLCEMIGRTTESMNVRTNAKQEIQMLLISKSYEQTIMSLMPIAILLYIRVANGDYLTPLYHNEMGIVIMTAALLLYVAAVVLGRRMLRIEVTS